MSSANQIMCKQCNWEEPNVTTGLCNECQSVTELSMKFDVFMLSNFLMEKAEVVDDIRSKIMLLLMNYEKLVEQEEEDRRKNELLIEEWSYTNCRCVNGQKSCVGCPYKFVNVKKQ